MNNKDTHIEHQVQPSIMRNDRPPVPQTSTRVENLFVDIDSEVKLGDLSEKISQSIRKMAARKSGEPGFWLHAFRFLNDFKDDIYTRLWTGEDEADHQARVVLAQRSAAIQIRLLIRGKHLPPALKSALTHLFGPALALLMLRPDQDRNSRTLLNAMQLVYAVIERNQESPIPLGSTSPTETELKQRVHDFFKGIKGIRQALTPQILAQLQSDDDFFLAVLEPDNGQTVRTDFTVQAVKNGKYDVSGIIPLPAPASPVASTPEHDGPKPDTLSAQASAAEASHHGTNINEPIIVTPSITVHEPVHTRAADSISTPEEAPPPALVNGSGEESVEPIKTDTCTLNNPALDALLERMMQKHRFTWFQVQACQDCRLRRLMFGSYEREKQLVIWVDVRQKPSLTLSAADFDAGLQAGVTLPLDNKPTLNRLISDYLSLGTCSKFRSTDAVQAEIGRKNAA